MLSGTEKFIFLTFCVTSFLRVEADLRVVREWKTLEFNFPSEAAKQTAIERGYYSPGASVPIDVDVEPQQGSKKNRIFMTIPRFDAGRPVTLGTVDEQGLISGYPDYSWHDNQGNNCDGITSVFRTWIDECKRLWVIDSGKIGDTQHCQPQVLAFNLSDDQLLYRHRLNVSTYNCDTLFITPVVDVRGKTDNCENTFVYIADVTTMAIAVVDVARDRSWHATHRFFYPEPLWGRFTINNVSFEWMDGILGMAISPYRSEEDDRSLYFHALSSNKEGVVKTSTLRNAGLMEDPNAPTDSVELLPGDRPNQSAAEAMDSNGILFYGIMDPPSIWCWNSATKFSRRNFHLIEKNKETLQFASGVKVINNPAGGQQLWILTSRFQKVATDSLNSNETNFRILTGDISNLLKHSLCNAQYLKSCNYK